MTDTVLIDTQYTNTGELPPIISVLLHNCSEDQIERLPTLFFSAESIVLYYDSVQMPSVVFNYFDSLYKIEFRGSGINSIPKSIKQYKYLAYFGIHSTSIKKIPKFLIKISYNSFSVTNSHLKSLPKSFNKINVSYSMSLYNLGLEKVSGSIFNIESHFLYINDTNMIIDTKNIAKKAFLNKEQVDVKCKNNHELYEKMVDIYGDSLVIMDSTRVIFSWEKKTTGGNWK